MVEPDNAFNWHEFSIRHIITLLEFLMRQITYALHLMWRGNRSWFSLL